MSFMAIDIGNTRLKWALYASPQPGAAVLAHGAAFLETIDGLAEKDWQQLALIRAMAAERQPDIQIVGVPTVRDADGLALSSRNRYLSPSERETAALIPVVLRDIAASGGTDESLVRAAAKLDQAGIVLDYLDVVDPVTLEPVRGAGPACAIIAARVGTTRLIDNLSLEHVRLRCENVTSK